MKALGFAALLFAALGHSQTLFESEVRSVLTNNCLKCHGGEQTLGGFDMRTSASFAKGGNHGPAVVPGKPDASRLIEWVASGKMPMGGARLAAKDIDALRRWVASGAAFPEAVSLGEAKKVFWSLRAPVKPAVPSIDGVSHPVDAFILDKLRSRGLTFAPQADARTLIRRLHFDLTGLPPAPEEFNLGYEETVARLLASRHYGERWGRYWLDVVRFGETDGGEHNYERKHAWRYRDYVIDSFHNDKPYNQFIREQLTGDLIAPQDPTMVAATGFLVAGPWDQVSAELNKDKLMAATARMDELDDMVTTTFHTFQAMTVNCARCHDHKFDPIPTRDYYKLTAVFRGVGFGNRKIATSEQEAEYDRLSKPVRTELDSVKQALAKIEDPVRTQLLRAKYIAVDRARDGEHQRLTVNPIWNRNRFKPARARYYRLVISDHAGKLPKVTGLRLLPQGPSLAEWEGTVKATSDSPVTVPLGEANGPVTEMIWAGQTNVYRLEASEDNQSWSIVCSSLDHVGRNELDLPTVSESELIQQLAGTDRAQREALIARRTELEQALKAIPDPPLVYSARPRALEPAFLLERGNVARPRDPVTPGTLTAVSQLPSDFGMSNTTADAARRQALADWIVNPRNPLTARVIVNRVWQYHFGHGLVNTPSDFGLNGDRPSHPELLDWLAVSFVENGYSIKWLHRLILSSRTWQQSDRFDEKANSIDAGNRLLWRMPLKRMDAETLRDSILFVTGKLDLNHRGGPSFPLQKMGSGGSYIYAPLNNDGPGVWKRAVYRFVVRGGERIMLDSFDCPDPSVATPQRTVSNTPVQAFTLLNNEFVVKQAGFLAERLDREAGPDPARRIRRAYQLLYGRDADPREVRLGEEFLKSQPLAIYCRALLNANEFVYVP
jgi:mono/diheme cytochrome c family protein